MLLSTQLVTPPIVEPLSLETAKLQLRVDDTYNDTLISALITAAREYCEKYTRRTFFNQTWLRTLDFFPLYGHVEGSRTPAERYNWPYGTWYWDKVTIDLPYPRTLGVQSITYLDNNAQQQTLPTTSYNVDCTSIPARIAPAQGMFWPILNNYIPGSVKITFTAGSYVTAVTETITVPSQAPYGYTPAQSPVTAITSVLDADGNTPSYTFEDGILTFTEASAGQSYTLSYYVGNCPMAIQQAMLLLITHWYQHSLVAPSPGSVPTPVDKAVSALLGMYRINVIEYR